MGTGERALLRFPQIPFFQEKTIERYPFLIGKGAFKTYPIQLEVASDAPGINLSIYNSRAARRINMLKHLIMEQKRFCGEYLPGSHIHVFSALLQLPCPLQSSPIPGHPGTSHNDPRHPLSSSQTHDSF